MPLHPDGSFKVKLQQVGSKQPIRMVSPPPVGSAKEQEAQTGVSKLCSRKGSECGNAASEEDHSVRPLDAKLGSHIQRDLSGEFANTGDQDRDMESPMLKDNVESLVCIDDQNNATLGFSPLVTQSGFPVQK